MTTFTPIKATGTHFYRYQSADHLDRLKTILLEHALYLPSVAQLNDPTDCRPKIAPMSDEDMVTFNFLSLWAKYAADHTGYCLEFANEEHYSKLLRMCDSCFAKKS